MAKFKIDLSTSDYYFKDEFVNEGWDLEQLSGSNIPNNEGHWAYLTKEID